MQQLVRNRAYLGELEQGLRRALLDDAAFAVNLDKNVALKACWQEDGTNCPSLPKNLDLVTLRNQPLTGPFPAPGKTCSAPQDCPLLIQASFRSVCEQATSTCDMASAVLIDYKIQLQESVSKRTVLRQGFLQKMNPKRLVNDKNIVCPLTSQGLASFASAIGPQKLACAPPPPFQRTLAGVVPKTCDLAQKEILVGFAPSGQALCAKAKGVGP
jgi:hypothetical protein